VDLGLKLAKFGWIPRMLEVDQPVAVRIAGCSCKGRRYLVLSNHGCHTGGFVWAPTRRKLSKNAVLETLHETFGSGQIVEIRPGRVLVLRRGMTSLGDLARRTSVNKSRVKLSDFKRAELIRRTVRWLRGSEQRDWSGLTVLFRLARTFRASKVRWKLFSDLFFYRGEGLYWNSWLTSAEVDLKTFKLLVSSGFYRRITGELKDMGFRVQPPHNAGLAFDQDFLPIAELLGKARQIARWKPLASQGH
jgi:hypothetical protein